MKIEMLPARQKPWASLHDRLSAICRLCADGREAALLMNRRNASPA